MPHSVYSVRLQTFPPKEAPFWLVTGLLAPSDVSSVWSSCGLSSELEEDVVVRGIHGEWLDLTHLMPGFKPSGVEMGKNQHKVLNVRMERSSVLDKLAKRGCSTGPSKFDQGHL